MPATRVLFNVHRIKSPSAASWLFFRFLFCLQMLLGCVCHRILALSTLIEEDIVVCHYVD